MIGGREVRVNYGWPDAGETLGVNEVDTVVLYSGFTATLLDYAHTRFELNGAPDPATCSVTYEEAWTRGPVLGMEITTNTSGC